MPDTFEVSLTVIGTNVAVWFWNNFPTMHATCTTPLFRQKKIAECSKRYSLDGIMTLDELRALPNDLEMVGESFSNLSIARRAN